MQNVSFPAKEFEQYQKRIEDAIESERSRRQQMETEQARFSSFSVKQAQDIAEQQLNLQEELDRIYHLLSGHVLGISDGNEVWLEPQDDRLKIFSEYGVKQIMNIILFYINKNTLLSNYDEETIRWKVKDFAIELSDLIYNRYESFFHYPTPEELFDIYKPIMNRQRLNITEEELYQKCIHWSNEELSSKMRHYPMIVMAVVDSVHSTYLRALNGEERESLRKIMHVSQSANMNEASKKPNQSFSIWRPSSWSR